MKVLAETSQLEAIAFNFGHLTETAAALEQNTDLVFSIENVWNGQEKMQYQRFPFPRRGRQFCQVRWLFSFSTVKAGQDYFCSNNSLTCCWKSSNSAAEAQVSRSFPPREYGLVLSFSADCLRNMVSVVPGWTGKEKDYFLRENTDRRHRCFSCPFGNHFFY